MPGSKATQNPSPNAARPPLPAKFHEAFLYWLKLGFISFGGPAGQISIMHHDLVEQKKWISNNRFIHALNFCMILPGPEAQQLSIYIGWLMHGTAGGLVAGILFILPSFIILNILGWIYMSYGTLPVIAGIFYGIKPAVVAIVIFASYRIGVRTLKNNTYLYLAVLSFIAVFLHLVSFPLIILLAGLAGYILNINTIVEVKPLFIDNKLIHSNALINDDTPLPEYAKFRWNRFIKVATVGMTIWCFSMMMLIHVYGSDSIAIKLSLFFTKAACLTFGGAYAVLPYVMQGAVEQYHWLSPNQMIDALALGETTPGPLIMVVTFVGFISGWSSQSFITGMPLSSALIGASIVTFFTFLPSFLLIFLGAPFIESSFGNLKLIAPLESISAAIVGVILNLAIFFAVHVFFPKGVTGSPDFVSLGMVILALIGIFRFKVGTIPIIFSCGVVGMAIKLVNLS